MRIPAHQLNGEEPMSIVKWSQCFNSKGLCNVNPENLTLEILNHDKKRVDVQNLMTGKEFLKQVNRRHLTNNNCKLIEIMIDGYRSDWGLYHKNINQGFLRFNKRQFKKLCKRYKVMVLWDNVEGAENG